MVSPTRRQTLRRGAGALLLALVSACTPVRPSTQPLAEGELDAYRTGCTSDDQCVLASNGCCACENGTPQVAVLRARASAFAAQFRCDHAECPTGGDPTCGALRARCVAGRCSVVAE
jgi:hypothetical protein